MGFWDSVRRFLGVETKKFSREEAQKLFNEFAFFVKEKPELKTSDIEKFLRERKALGFVHLEDTLVDEFIVGLPKLFVELCSTNRWKRIKDIYWAFGIFLKDKEKLDARITSYIPSLELDEVTLRCLCDVLPPVKCPKKESTSRDYSTDVQLAFGPEAWEEEIKKTASLIYKFVKRELVIEGELTDLDEFYRLLLAASFKQAEGGYPLRVFNDEGFDWSKIKIDFPRFWKDLKKKNVWEAVVNEFGWDLVSLVAENEEEEELFENEKQPELLKKRLLNKKEVILSDNWGKEILLEALFRTAFSYACSYEEKRKLCKSEKFLKWIEVISIDDGRTCNLCKNKDYKLLAIDEFKKARIFKDLPPYHVGCRCTFRGIFKGSYEAKEIERKLKK